MYGCDRRTTFICALTPFCDSSNVSTHIIEMSDGLRRLGVQQVNHEQMQNLVTLSYNLGWLSSRVPLQSYKILQQLK